MSAADIAAIIRGTDSQTALACSHFCPVAEFPSTLGIDRAPLTKYGLIGTDGMVTTLGREVWKLCEEA